MNLFWKACAALLICAFLGATFRQEKDLALMLAACGTILAVSAVVSYLSPVLELLRDLSASDSISGSFLDTLLKASAVAVTAETVASICTDSGNSSLGKAAQLLGSAATLYLSVPLLESLMTIIQNTMG